VKKQKNIKLLKTAFILILFISCPSCSIIRGTYAVTTGTVKATYNATKTVANTAIGTSKVVYKVGGFAFTVVKAPISWPLTHSEIETIDGLSPKEAIKQGKVKKSPYVVRGKKYYPMSIEQAKTYKETGIASWYGNETLRQKGGHMTANGEAFDPNGLSAAHKHLPLPAYVRVTNLKNRKSIIVRVNDRGPFIDNRIIDLSTGAAKKLGFYKDGTTRVLVETVEG
jgi:rare lipoprotein A